MNLKDPRLLRVLAGVGLLAGCVWAYQSMYATPRDALLADAQSLRSSIASIERDLEGEAEVRKRQKALGERTLGARQDLVTNRFRIALARLAERAGLSEVVVETGDPKDTRNPVVDAKGIASALKRDLRASPGFGVMRGRVQGNGTYEQAVAAVAWAQSQPWIHRVEGLTIKPLDRERKRFQVTLDVGTIHAPAWAKDEGTDPALAELIPETDAAYRVMASRNPFVKPAPAGPAPVRVANPGKPGPANVAPVMPAYEDWKLTGVVVGRGGLEAMLHNTRSGERLTVTKGAQVLDAVLVDGGGDQAVFEIRGARFEIKNGETLASRRPLG